MEREFTLNDKLSDEELDGELDEELDDQNFYLKGTDFCSAEIDLYPSYDDRVWESNVEDIDGGDNFADYCKYIFKLYEDEGCYDN